MPTTLRFARAARVLAGEARRLGLQVPGFRAPPGVPGHDRTIRRAHWGAVVAVRVRDRPFEAVVTDMVEGVLRANRLEGDAARSTRERLLQALHAADPTPAPGVADAA